MKLFLYEVTTTKPTLPLKILLKKLQPPLPKPLISPFPIRQPRHPPIKNTFGYFVFAYQRLPRHFAAYGRAYRKLLHCPVGYYVLWIRSAVVVRLCFLLVAP